MVKQQERQFLQAYHQYFDALFRYCYYRVLDKEKTKDLVQETYCRTWKYIIKGKKIKNMKGFLYTTARNIIIDQSKKKEIFSLDQMMEKGFCPMMNSKDLQENYFIGCDLLKIVKSLDKKYAQVIMLKYIDGLSTEEISNTLDETKNNVYVRLSRGFSMAKELFLNHKNKESAKIILSSTFGPR